MSMRFTKFGKALCVGALSAGIIFGIASCVESYTVGFLYVTGTVTAQSGNNGIISGYKIDHNTGRLATINGLPVSSGGANPVRAVLTLGSRFLYVLNRGVNGSGNGNCYGVGANACQNANITEFAVGGNGVMTPQATFFTQGIDPFRLQVDSTGSFLLVLDHDAPDNVNPSTTDNCARALGSTVTTCGDITVFKIDQTTGRLSTVQNAQVTAASGSPINYFPVPANPVDFLLTGGFTLTLTGAPTPISYPYVGGSSVWPYTYNSSNGQMTLSQNGVQPLGIHAGTAMVSASGVLYVLDNEPITIGTSTNQIFPAGNYASQFLPFTIGSGGSLAAEQSGAIPDNAAQANPIQLMVESKGKYLYVANQGNNTAGNNPASGVSAYFLTTAPAFQLQFLTDLGGNFPSGSGPQCIVEDPSDQFIYEANEFDSSISGRALDPNTGDLNPLRTTDQYTLQGQPTWCLVDGRTG
jgi:6-phosphogluconolactonase (cycloisomerase 2 family)